MAEPSRVIGSPGKESKKRTFILSLYVSMSK